MKRTIEVEIRGPLAKKGYFRLKKQLRIKGTFIGVKNRVLIDYTTFLEKSFQERKRDIRLRSTNGIPEIIVKLGSWGKEESREELSATGTENDFDKLVRLFSVLGYKKGVLCVREIEVFEYKGIEISLVEVPNHSCYFEAEKIISTTNQKAKVIQKIKSVLSEFNLRTFTQEEYFEYLNKLNSEANEVFNYEKVEPDYFKKRFGI